MWKWLLAQILRQRRKERLVKHERHGHGVPTLYEHRGST